MKSSDAFYMGVGIVWAAMLLAVGSVMRGTPQATEVIMLIGGGVAVTFALLGGSRRSTQASKL